jgi:AmmeMemoRadiSam system protein A
MDLTPQTRRLLLDLASDAIVSALGGSPKLSTPIDDPFLSQSAGCFVSLHHRQTRALRGCVGLLESDRPLSEVIIAAARSVLADPRFTHDPIHLNELVLLDIEVTLLHPMRQVPSPLDFNPLEHGLYLTISTRSGCFLPQVARETGWTREQLLSRLCTEKLGLHPEAWRDPGAVLRIFTVEVIGPAQLK